MIKAAFFDADGTLVSYKNKVISDLLVADLAELRRRGIKIFLATGRSKTDLTHTGMLKTAEFDGYITLSGQYCYDQNGVYRDAPICREDIVNACRVFQENPTFATKMEAGEHTYLNCVTDRLREMFAFLHTELFETRPADWMLERSIYQLVAMLDEEEGEKLMAVMPHCMLNRWHPTGVDIFPQGGGKADGIRATLDHYGLTADEVVAFGDGPNDVSMLQMAGIGVAMGNATEVLKAEADYVTDTVENEGISQALRHFGLL